MLFGLTLKRRYLSIMLQLGDRIYLSNWHNKSIERADKTTGRERVVIRQQLGEVLDVRAVAEVRQPSWPNACSMNSCSHLCLARPEGHTCACPDISDGRKCQHGNFTHLLALIRIIFSPQTTFISYNFQLNFNFHQLRIALQINLQIKDYCLTILIEISLKVELDSVNPVFGLNILVIIKII